MKKIIQIRKIKDIEGFKLYIIPCRGVISADIREIYNKTYDLWKCVWSKTLKELDGLEKLHSDQFTRYDYALVIFDNEQAVSMICCKEIDMKLASSGDDSWFSCWPEDILAKQNQRVGRGVIAAWFCTSEKFRKTKNSIPFNISQIIMETLSLYVLEGAYNVGYGLTRNNRNVGTYAFAAGAISVGQTIAHGCDVDLVLFEPVVLENRKHHYSNDSKYLFKNKIDYTRKEHEEYSLNNLSKSA